MISSSSLSVMVSKSANVSVCRETGGGGRGGQRTAVSTFFFFKYRIALWGKCGSVRDQSSPVTVTPSRTWFLSDMRKSSLDPGKPSSIKVFTSRRSALFPGGGRENHKPVLTQLLCREAHKSLKETPGVRSAELASAHSDSRRCLNFVQRTEMLLRLW